jgi:Ca2+-binding RTX toxin-like protein
MAANYLVAIDNFKVIRDGSTFFEDTFGDGVPPVSGPNGPATYIGSPSGFSEAGGEAVMDSATSPVAGTFAEFSTVLTSTLARLNSGTGAGAQLKSEHDLVVEGVFDTYVPAAQTYYGVRLTDQTNAVDGDDAITVAVWTGTDGITRVVLIETDFVAGEFNILSSTVVDFGTNDQIRLRLSHDDDNLGVITASYDLLTAGTVTFSDTLAEVAQIFGTETPGDTSDDEVFTRAQFIAIGPDLDDPAFNVIDGEENDNTLVGTADADGIRGHGGDDLIDAGGGNDSVRAGEGDDTIVGGAGDDTLNGSEDANGLDFDDVDYSGATGAIQVDLRIAGPQAIGGGQGTDTLLNIEAIIGGGLGDTLAGDDNANGIDGRNGADRIFGHGGDDELIGGTGPDTIDGGEGHDWIAGGIGNDSLIGGLGTDTIFYNDLNGAVTVNLSSAAAQATGQGTDTLSGFENIVGGIGNDKFIGTTGGNRMEGAGGSDQLNGLGGADTLIGGSGNDNIQGGAGNDVIIGGAGRDIMVGGGDSDTFVFESASDSAVGGQRDRVNDFVQGADKIDVELIDAMTGGADDDFAFIGTGAFSGSGAQGELRFFQLAGPGQTIVEGDIDGNGSADFQIAFVGLIAFAGTDFLGVV